MDRMIQTRRPVVRFAIIVMPVHVSVAAVGDVNAVLVEIFVHLAANVVTNCDCCLLFW